MLILDGHVSHLSGKLIKAAQDNSVILLKLPAHVTDVLQPLDVTCFGPIKRRWQAVLNQIGSLHGTRNALNKATFVDELCSVWMEYLNTRNVSSGFHATGIFPPNRKQYPTLRFDPGLFQRFNNWKADGKELDVITMASSLVTPRKPSSSLEQRLDAGIELTFFSPIKNTSIVTECVCHQLGPKPSVYPGLGKE